MGVCSGRRAYLNPAEPAAVTMWCRAWPSFCRTTRWTASTLTIILPYDRRKHRCGAVCGQRCGRPCSMAAAERDRSGQEGARHGEDCRPDAALWHQSAGESDNDLNSQYSDVTAWLAPQAGEEQVVDYLCPQIYWGYGYAAERQHPICLFENIVPAWLAYPRAEGVALYFGLGAYRVGAGDGGAEPGQRKRLEHRRCWPGRCRTCAAGTRAAGRCTGTAVCLALGAPEQAAAE